MTWKLSEHRPLASPLLAWPHHYMDMRVCKPTLRSASSPPFSRILSIVPASPLCFTTPSSS